MREHSQSRRRSRREFKLPGIALFGIAPGSTGRPRFQLPGNSLNFHLACCLGKTRGDMSFWVTRKGPGKRKSVFTISIAWEIVPLTMIGLAVIVLMFFKN